MDYVAKAFGAWFVGFFPLAEIYVAVPTAMATGLDDLSVIFWTVFGNFTPAILISLFYLQLMRYERIQNWLRGLVSEKMTERINRYGLWVVLFLTPWTGIWAMAVTVKTLGMKDRLFYPAAFLSILAYAIILVVLLRTGASLVS